VLDGSPAVLRDVAMTTNFGTQFVITGFVSYGCMIASDMQFDSRGGFSESSYSIKTQPIPSVKGSLPWQPILGLKSAINWLCVNDSD